MYLLLVQLWQHDLLNSSIARHWAEMHRKRFFMVLANLRPMLRLIAPLLRLCWLELGVAVLVPWLGEALLRLLGVQQLGPAELLRGDQHVLTIFSAWVWHLAALNLVLAETTVHRLQVRQSGLPWQAFKFFETRCLLENGFLLPSRVLRKLVGRLALLPEVGVCRDTGTEVSHAVFLYADGKLSSGLSLRMSWLEYVDLKVGGIFARHERFTAQH